MGSLPRSSRAMVLTTSCGSGTPNSSNVARPERLSKMHELARRVKQRAHALGVRLRPRRADVDLEPRRAARAGERPHAWPGLGPQPRIRHPVQTDTSPRPGFPRTGPFFVVGVLRLDLCGDARLEQRVRAVSRAVLDRRAVQQRVVEIEHQPSLRRSRASISRAVSSSSLARDFCSGDGAHPLQRRRGSGRTSDEGVSGGRSRLRAPRDVFENRFVVCSPPADRRGRRRFAVQAPPRRLCRSPRSPPR